MKKFKIYAIGLLITSLSFSCLVDDEIDKDTQLYNGPLVVGFKDAETLGNFVEETGATFDFNVPVHLIGGAAGQPSNVDITLTYEVGTLNDLGLDADELAVYNEINDNGTPDDTSDDYRVFPLAEQGVHYDFNDTVLESVIPATASFDLIPLSVYNDALDNAKTTLMVLNITQVASIDNVVIGEQRKSTLIKFQLCRTDLAGNYTINYTSGPRTHVVTHLGSGNYQLDSMMGWPGAGYWANFYACAGELVFTEWRFSNEIIQGRPGFVGQNGELIFVEFGIGRSSGPPIFSGRTYTLTPQ